MQTTNLTKRLNFSTFRPNFYRSCHGGLPKTTEIIVEDSRSPYAPTPIFVYKFCIESTAV